MVGEEEVRPYLAGVAEVGEPCPQRQGKAVVEVVERQVLRAAAAVEVVEPDLAGEEVEEDQRRAPLGVAVGEEEVAGEVLGTGQEEEGVVAVVEQHPAASGQRRQRRGCRSSPRCSRSARPCPPSAAVRPPRDDRRSLW